MLWALGCSALYWILDSTPTRLVTITSLAAALIVGRAACSCSAPAANPC
jgi:hypothetical protein